MEGRLPRDLVHREIRIVRLVMHAPGTGRADYGFKAVTIAALMGMLIVFAALVGGGVEDMGDGVQHYLFARYVWAHPYLLLDQWAKPLFTLLASPFAQAGYGGMALFNALVVICCTWAVQPLLKRAGPLAQYLFPITIMLSPIGAHLIMQGMTEILFGCIAAVAVVLLYRGSPMMAAALAGCTPLCRPEYGVFLPCFALWLVIDRKWRALPLLLTGILAYTVYGILLEGDPLCWWNRAPYPGGSVYGKGDALRFIGHAPEAFGWPLLFLFMTALLLRARVARKVKEERRMAALLALTTVLPVFGIVGVHTYACATGTHGSAGFPRVMVSALPLMGLFALDTWGRSDLVRNLGRKGFSLVTSLVTAGTLVQLVTYAPVIPTPGPDQLALERACGILMANTRDDQAIFATHPFVALRTGRDMFDDRRFSLMWGTGMLDERVRRGDKVLWESQFGPNEFGVPLAHMLNDTAYALIDLVEPEKGHAVLGGHPYELWIFERARAVRSYTDIPLWSQGDTVNGVVARFDTVPCEQAPAWCATNEFPWTVDNLPVPDRDVAYQEIRTTLDVHYKADGGGHAAMVYKELDNGRNVRYDERWLEEGIDTAVFRMARRDVGYTNQFYFWLPPGSAMSVNSMKVVRRVVKQERR